MVLTVHDELVFEVPDAEVDAAKAKVKAAMEGVLSLDVPLAVDVGAGKTVVAFPEAAGAVNTYPVAVLEQATDVELARRFVDLVTGEAGQKELSKAGFATP